MIELLVIIAIIAVLAAFSMAVFGGYKRKADRLKEQATQTNVLLDDTQEKEQKDTNSPRLPSPSESGMSDTATHSQTGNELTNATSPERSKTAANEEAEKESLDDALTDPKILLLFIGAGFGIFAFTYKQLLGHLNARSELGVTEVLSIHGGTERTELAAKAKNAFRHMRWIPGTFTDALASLHAKGKVEISDGKYSLATKPKDSDSEKEG